MEPSWLNFDDCDGALFCAMDVVKPGKRIDFVRFAVEGEKDEEECFVAEVRRKEVPVRVRETKVFNKAVSPFNHWNADTPSSLDLAAIGDLHHWTLPEARDLMKVSRVFFGPLKDIFVSLACSEVDDYPNVS